MDDEYKEKIERCFSNINTTNWVKKLNIINRRLKEVVLDKAVDLYIKHCVYLEKNLANMQELILHIKFTDFKNTKEKIDFFIKLQEKIDEIYEIYLKDEKEQKQMFKEIQIFVIYILDNYLYNSYYFINNYRDKNKINWRIKIICLNQTSILINFVNSTMNIFNKTFKELDELINNFKETLYLELKNDFKEYTEKSNMDMQQQKEEYFKIFNYKDMFQLAESYGYKKVRQTGDHAMFQHNKTKKLIPIPTHTLGKGLMLNIQKQLIKGGI